MATVRECISEEQRSLVHFLLLTKGFNEKYIHKEIIVVCDGKCLSRKAVPPW
jgi:hypothetical protein